MSKSVIEVLREARALVAKGWCQIHNAVDSRGHPIDAEQPSACKWCLHGALIRACGPGQIRESAHSLLFRSVHDDFGFIAGGAIGFNDTPGRTQEEVIQLFTKAIERAEAVA